MACSICGGDGHNRRTCGGRGSSVSYQDAVKAPVHYVPTPTPPPVTWGPPMGPFHPNAYGGPPVARRGPSGAVIALLCLAGLVVMGFGGCVLCVALGAPGPHASAPSERPVPAALRPAEIGAPPAESPPAEPVPPPTPVSKPAPVAPAAAPARKPQSSPGAAGGGRARCCDGTTSPSCGCGGGRGCCSRHGGVCGCQ